MAQSLRSQEGLLGPIVTQVTAEVITLGTGLERARWLHGFTELQRMASRGKFT